jgi:hypothetical protein
MALRFSAPHLNQGFDANGAGPGQPALVVPDGGHNEVLLTGASDASISLADSSSTRFVQQAAAGGTVRISIFSRGETRTTLTATIGSGRRIDLSIVTLPRVTVPVSFHEFSDSVTHTNRPVSQAGRILAEMNEILTPQTNIVFELSQTTPFHYNQPIGNVIDDRYHHLFTGWNPPGDFHVFFVWECERDYTRMVRSRQSRRGSPDRREAVSFAYDYCLMEDRLVTTPGRILAHEAGHYLGLYVDGTHNPSRHSLMYATAPAGNHLSTSEATNMNYNARMNRRGLFANLPNVANLI